MSEQSEEALAGAVHDAIQGQLNDHGQMLQSWYLVGTYIDEDGDEGLILTNDEGSRLSRSLGLVKYALVVLEDEVREWHREE